MTQDIYGRTITATPQPDGSVVYTATDPATHGGADSGIALTCPADKHIDAVLTTLNAMAPEWWAPDPPAA